MVINLAVACCVAGGPGFGRDTGPRCPYRVFRHRETAMWTYAQRVGLRYLRSMAMRSLCVLPLLHPEQIHYLMALGQRVLREVSLKGKLSPALPFGEIPTWQISRRTTWGHGLSRRQRINEEGLYRIAPVPMVATDGALACQRAAPSFVGVGLERYDQYAAGRRCLGFWSKGWD